MNNITGERAEMETFCPYTWGGRKYLKIKLGRSKGLLGRNKGLLGRIRFVSLVKVCEVGCLENCGMNVSVCCFSGLFSEMVRVRGIDTLFDHL